MLVSDGCPPMFPNGVSEGKRGEDQRGDEEPVGIKTPLDVAVDGFGGVDLKARQAEIADRNDAAPVFSALRTITIRKSIELLEITERVAGLPLDPGAKPRLKAAMALLEWAGRQRGAVGDR